MMIGKSIGLSVKRIMTRNSPLLSYGVALLNVALALAVSLLLGSLTQPTPLALFYVAVMVSAWYGGLRPGLVATLLSTLVISYFIPPYNSLSIIHLGNVLRLGVFVLAALLISGLNQARRTALRQEQQLRAESETTHRRTAHLLEHMTDAFVALDRDWRIIYVNAEAERLNKKPRSTMVGKTHWEEWPASLGTQVEHQYRRAMTERIAVHFEHRYYAPPDYDVWLEIRAYPSEDGLGIFYRDISDRKQAELVLVEQKQLLEKIALGHPLDGCLSALCDSVSRLNPRARACILLTDAQGLTFSRSITPDFPPSFGQGLKDAPINELCIGTCGEAVYLGQPITCADIANDDRWSREWCDLCMAHGILACHSVPILGIKNQPLGSLMLCFDEARLPSDWEYQLATFGIQVASIVLERDRANAALRQSEEQLRLATESANLGLWHWDVQRDTLIWTEQCKALFGLPSDTEMSYQVFLNALHPDDRQRIQNMRSVLEHGRLEHHEHQYRTLWPDGTVRWLMARGTATYDADRKPVFSMGVIFDITDHKQAEIALHVKSAELRHVTETAGIGLTRCSRDLRYLSANPAYAQLAGMAVEEIVGKPIVEVMGETAFEVIRPYIDRVLRGERVEYEAQVPFAASRMRNLYVVYMPDEDSSGNIIGWIASVIDISDRKRAEEDLRRSEAAFRTISNAAPALVWVCSPEGENIFFNDRWYEFTGQTKAEAVGLGWTETMHPDDAAQILPYWKRCQQTGEPYEGEVRYRRHDGEYRWHTFRALPRRNTDGDIEAWYGLSVDINDRKQAETALSESERRFRRLVESNMFGVAFGNFTGGIHYVNEYFLNMVGYTREEIETGQVKWTDITPPEFLPLDEQAMVELRTNGVATPFEKEYIRKDGTRVPILIGSTLLQEPYDRQQEMIGFFVDLSDRKQAEEELRQKNAILNVINESTPTPIFVKDRQGRIIYANPATLKVLGKSAEQVIGSCDCDLYPNPEDAARVMENDRRIMETGQMEVVEESPDGIRTFLGIKVPYRNESGEVIGLIGISNDISERVQIERDRERVLQQEQAARQVAEEANRIKDEFLAVLSHELRSPLNPILGWTRLLQNGNLDAARQREALATIERNAKLQTQLIEDLLDISRIMQGKLTLTAAPVSLTFVISAAVETVRLAAAAKQIQILLDLSTGIAPVSGDAARLQQVVWNLLSNAVKFTPNGGQVIVELRQLNGLAQIRVIDTGKGISPDFLPYVFEYFRQADATTTRKFGGLGLGLAIVRQIVEMHGGTVKAESLGENQGATLTVQLPSIQQAILTAPEPAPAKAETTEAPLSNLQILLVDDDADTREFQAFLLEQSGANVTAVASGLEALQALERFIPNVIVSDIGMAEMDGYMLMQEIRSHPNYRRRRIPAIALTAYARDFDQQKALQVGFQSHITKPVEPEALIEGILMLLRQPDYSLTQTTVDRHKKTLSDHFH
jgi:PAS domain S-box-containing protein